MWPISFHCTSPDYYAAGAARSEDAYLGGQDPVEKSEKEQTSIQLPINRYELAKTGLSFSA